MSKDASDDIPQVAKRRSREDRSFHEESKFGSIDSTDRSQNSTKEKHKHSSGSGSSSSLRSKPTQKRSEATNEITSDNDSLSNEDRDQRLFRSQQKSKTTQKAPSSNTNTDMNRRLSSPSSSLQAKSTNLSTNKSLIKSSKSTKPISGSTTSKHVSHRDTNENRSSRQGRNYLAEPKVNLSITNLPRCWELLNPHHQMVAAQLAMQSRIKRLDYKIRSCLCRHARIWFYRLHLECQQEMIFHNILKELRETHAQDGYNPIRARKYTQEVNNMNPKILEFINNTLLTIILKSQPDFIEMLEYRISYEMALQSPAMYIPIADGESSSSGLEFTAIVPQTPLIVDIREFFNRYMHYVSDAIIYWTNSSTYKSINVNGAANSGLWNLDVFDDILDREARKTIDHCIPIKILGTQQTFIENALADSKQQNREQTENTPFFIHRESWLRQCIYSMEKGNRLLIRKMSAFYGSQGLNGGVVAQSGTTTTPSGISPSGTTQNGGNAQDKVEEISFKPKNYNSESNNQKLEGIMMDQAKVLMDIKFVLEKYLPFLATQTTTNIPTVAASMTTSTVPHTQTQTQIQTQTHSGLNGPSGFQTTGTGSQIKFSAPQINNILQEKHNSLPLNVVSSPAAMTHPSQPKMNGLSPEEAQLFEQLQQRILQQAQQRILQQSQQQLPHQTQQPQPYQQQQQQQQNTVNTNTNSSTTHTQNNLKTLADYGEKLAKNLGFINSLESRKGTKPGQDKLDFGL